MTAPTAQNGVLSTRLLIFGIGNCGRSDDGLGWEFLDRLDTLPCLGPQTEYRYQLQVEDAAMVRDAECIVFVDACHDPLEGGFAMEICKPAPAVEFTSHALAPQAVLQVCSDLYGDPPPAYLLTISGVRWDLKTGLSETARANLEKALTYFLDTFMKQAKAV